MSSASMHAKVAKKTPANTEDTGLNGHSINFQEPLPSCRSKIVELESVSQQALQDFEELVTQMKSRSEKRLLESFAPPARGDSSYHQPKEVNSIQVHTGFLTGAPIIELSYLPGREEGFFTHGEAAELRASHTFELRTSQFLDLTITKIDEASGSLITKSLPELLKDTITWMKDIVDYVVKEGQIRAHVNAIADFNELFEVQLVRSVANILDLPELEFAYFEKFNHDQSVSHSQALLEPLRLAAQEVQGKIEDIKQQVVSLQQGILNEEVSTLVSQYKEQLTFEYEAKREQIDQDVNREVRKKHTQLVAAVFKLEAQKEHALREAKSRTLKFDYFAMIDEKIPDYQFDSSNYYSTQRLTKTDKAVWANTITKAALESTSDISPDDVKVVFEKLLNCAVVATRIRDIRADVMLRGEVEKIVNLAIYVMQKANQELLPILLSTLDGFKSAPLSIDVLTRTIEQFLA